MKTIFSRKALLIFMTAIALTAFYACEQDPLEGISDEVLQEIAPNEKRTENPVAMSEDDYIEGQLYVKLKDDYNKSFKSTSRDVDVSQLPFLNTLKNKHNFTVKSTFYFAKSSKLNRTLRVYLDDTKQTEALMRELKNNDEVEYVERVPMSRTSFTPNDLGANTTSGQWGLHKIQAQAAWNITQGNSTIVVAVVDDGVLTTHADFAGKTVAGRDVSDDDSNPNPPSNFGHGTHVAGIVGAATNNDTGVASIGYKVKVMPIKASPNNGSPGIIYDAYEGVAWAANNGADVVNMSWGNYDYNQTNANVINDAVAQGVVLVAAAGNNNTSNTFYPAGYPNVISVAATDINDNKASFSNYGSTIDVSAPGVSIRSTVVSGGYANWNGTSMASPMVAGLCGLVLSVDPTMSPAEVENCIKSTTDPIRSYSGNLGTGRINAFNALQCAADGEGPQTTFETKISHRNYDAEERISDGRMNQTSTDLEFGKDHSTEQHVGLRFKSISIPQGAQICDAYIEFVADGTTNSNFTVEITGHDHNDASTFSTSNYNISSRIRTSADVDWNFGNATWTTNQIVQSPDISSIVQEIINRGGWVSGNDMVLIFETKSGTGTRRVYSYDHDRDKSAKLVITYDGC